LEIGAHGGGRPIDYVLQERGGPRVSKGGAEAAEQKGRQRPG